MITSQFNILVGTLRELDQQIKTLQYLEVDRADIDELVHERTKIKWAIVDEIDKGN